jgi:hypothetical protein
MAVIRGVIMGLISGLLYGLLGYLKSGEKFDPRKLGKTLLLAAILGAVNYAFGLGLAGDDIAVMALAGETAILQFLIKIVGRWSG